MKNLRKVVTASLLVAAMGVTSVTVFAASKYGSPAEAAAALTGKSVEEVLQIRQEENKTLGTQVDEVGKLDEFQLEILEQKKEILQERVADGRLTQEQADEILANIETNQATCDGTGLGQGMMNGTGFGYGNCNGRGNGSGQGMMNGYGQGMMNGYGQGMMNGFGNCDRGGFYGN